MYQLTSYIDSEHIIIDPNNNIAYYHYKGPSYRDKMKNGLTLEQVYEQEDVYIFNETNDGEIVTQIKEIVFKATNNYDDDIKDISVRYEMNSKGLKGKGIKGKGLKGKGLKGKNKKTKISVRQNGYSDKIFMLNQNIPEEFDNEKHEKYYNSVQTMWIPCLCPSCDGYYSDLSYAHSLS